MSNYSFGTGGAPVARELLVVYLNMGTAEGPVWAPLGRKVTDSSERFDWDEENCRDILGNVYTVMKKPVITQNFEGWELTCGDEAQARIYNLAVVRHDAQALSGMDMLIAHFYTGADGAPGFAERYSACSVRPTGLGGEGGGNLVMGVAVTYGGERTVGAVARENGGVTFTPAALAEAGRHGGDPL